MASWQWSDQQRPSATIGVRATDGAVAVADDPNSPTRPYVFVRGYDSKLHTNWWDGKSWTWTNLGAPTGRTVLESVGAVTVQDSPSTGQRPYAFVITDDSTLHLNFWDGKTFAWADLGAPSGRRVREGVGVVSVQDTPTTGQRPYVFVLTDDFHLWLNFWDGRAWTWSDQGVPPGHTISRPLGVTTVRDSQTTGTRPYAFVITEDSRVWSNFWDGKTFVWADQGSPSGQLVKKGAGVVSVRDTPTTGERPYVFVQGYDSRLYLNFWDGKAWTWSDQGVPSGRLILDSVGAVTVQDTPTTGRRPYVFVIGDDSKLYANFWDGKAWTWSAQGTPTGRVIERPGAVTVAQEGASGAQRPYAFVITDDSDLAANYWSLA